MAGKARHDEASRRHRFQDEFFPVFYIVIAGLRAEHAIASRINQARASQGQDFFDFRGCGFARVRPGITLAREAVIPDLERGARHRRHGVKATIFCEIKQHGCGFPGGAEASRGFKPHQDLAGRHHAANKVGAEQPWPPRAGGEHQQIGAAFRAIGEPQRRTIRQGGRDLGGFENNALRGKVKAAAMPVSASIGKRVVI